MIQSTQRMLFGGVVVLLVVAGICLIGPMYESRPARAAPEDVTLTDKAADPLGNSQYDPFAAKAIEWSRVLRDHGVEDEIHAAESAVWDADFAEAVRLYKDALGQVEGEQEVALFIQCYLVTAYAMSDDREAVLQVAEAALPLAEQVAGGGERIQQPVLILSCMLVVNPIVLWGDDIRPEELTVAAQVAEHTAVSARELRILVEQWAQKHSAPKEGNSFDKLHDWANQSDALAARAQARLGRRAEAVSALREIVKDAERETTLGIVLYCLGVTLVETGARDEAQDALSQALLALGTVLADYGERCPQQYVWLHNDTERLLADMDPARRVAWFCRLWQENRLHEMPEFDAVSDEVRGAFLEAAWELAKDEDVGGLIHAGTPERLAGSQDDKASVSIKLSFGSDRPPLLVSGDTLFSLDYADEVWRIVGAEPAGTGGAQ